MEEGTERVYLQDIKTSSEALRNEANETKRILKKETERKHRTDSTIRSARKKFSFPHKRNKHVTKLNVCVPACGRERKKHHKRLERSSGLQKKACQSPKRERKRTGERRRDLDFRWKRGDNCVRRGRGGKCKEEKREIARQTYTIYQGKLEWCAIPSQFSFYFAVWVRCSPVLPLRNSCFAQQLPSSPAIFFPVRTQGNDERLCPGPLFRGPESGPVDWDVD
jgi:hypothetical protein